MKIYKRKHPITGKSVSTMRSVWLKKLIGNFTCKKIRIIWANNKRNKFSSTLPQELENLLTLNFQKLNPNTVRYLNGFYTEGMERKDKEMNKITVKTILCKVIVTDHKKINGIWKINTL